MNVQLEVQECIERIMCRDARLGGILESHKFKTGKIELILDEELCLCRCSECGFRVYFYLNSPYTARDIEARFYRPPGSILASCEETIIREII